MKAAIWREYGSPEVLQIKEIEKPNPKDDEILIKIHATTATMGDCEFRSLDLSFFLRILMRLVNGLIRPKRFNILGQEFAGEVEALGKDVKLFAPGDKVFGATGFGMGTYAEYKCMPEEGTLVIKPKNLNYEKAAAVPVGGLNAIHFLKKADIQSGQKLLINGAGGSIGTFAVQLAKHYGVEVSAVDSTEKIDLLRTIGADHIIDYTQEDFTKSGELYDVIFDIVGKASYSGCIKSLKKKGVLLLGNSKLSRIIRGYWTDKKVIGGSASYNIEDLKFLKALIEEGEIKPVVDKIYPLEQIVEAHNYVESGQKKGNVVIKLE